MSDEGDYSIVSGYIDSDTGYPNVNNVALKEGESAGSEDLEIIVVALLLGAVAFVLIGLGLGAFVMDKKTGLNPGAKTQDGIEPIEPVSTSPDPVTPTTEPGMPMEPSEPVSGFESSLKNPPSQPPNIPPPPTD
jgi:hypothetical protein